MQEAPDLGRWVRWLTLFMWAAVGLAMAVETHVREGHLPLLCALSWGGAFVVCGLSFLLLIREGTLRWPRWAWVAVLAVESGSVLFMIGWWRSVLGGFLLVLGAWQAARLLSFRASLGWVAAQTALLAAIMVNQDSPVLWLVVALVCGGLQLFAVLVAALVRSEETARLRLARAYSELRGAHELLAQTSRAGERVRVARELHDGMGHGLTALNLALESAQHDLAEPPAGLLRARQLVRSLLGELRQVVGRLREEPAVDLEAGLGELVADIEKPRIHLELGGSCARVDAARAQALLRCAQELLTNVIKHAQAANAWIALTCSAGGERLVVRDDGRGTANLAEGHGLRGIRERVAAFGGALELDPRAGGFVAAVTIPAGGEGR